MVPALTTAVLIPMPFRNSSPKRSATRRSIATAARTAASARHHRHLAALPREHVITLLQQPRRERLVDISAESRLKSLPLSQTRLHAVTDPAGRLNVRLL